MNEQMPPHGIEWTRAKLPGEDKPRRGYTNNFIAGCRHDCHWTMLDEQTGNEVVIECYAKRIAENLATKNYGQGFASHYVRESELNAIRRLKEPSGIFLSSMGDLFGAQVPDTDIDRLMSICLELDQHIYFTLTKDPARMFRYFYTWPADTFPKSVWLGVSMPADTMNRKVMTPELKAGWLKNALHRLGILRLAYGQTTWMSFEPLSWDVAPIVAQENMSISWAVIGAASNGGKYYPPDHGHLVALQDVLDAAGVPIFHKGNLRPFLKAWEMPVREEFPNL